MTTYNTGNPLGSSDPRDLFDNAENLDEAANSSADTFQDRLGKSRLTWSGIVKAGTGDAGVIVPVVQQAVQDVVAGVEGAVEQAETAAAAALGSGNVYANTAIGLANTVNGQLFLQNTLNPQVFNIYRNSNNTAAIPSGIFTVAAAGGSEVPAKSVTRAKLADQFSFNSVMTSGDLNAQRLPEGTYIVGASVANRPSGVLGGNAALKVVPVGLWDIHEISSIDYPERTFRRVFHFDNGAFGEWIPFGGSGGGGDVPDGSITRSKLAATYSYNALISDGSMDRAFNEGSYLIGSSVTERPAGMPGGNIHLAVEPAGAWFIQRATHILDPRYRFVRVVRPNQSSYPSWQPSGAMMGGSDNRLLGKTVVFLGDSITDGYGMPSRVRNMLGINAINCGIGGTRMGVHSDTGYGGLSGWKIAESIQTGDWAPVIDAAALTGTTSASNRAAQLAEVDWASVDYLVVGYGTNDFGGDRQIGNIDDADENSFYGATNLFITSIQATYPNIRIMFWTPIWRRRTPTDVSGIAGGSDVSPNTHGLYLYQFGEALQAMCKRHHLECLELYYTSGISEATYPQYLADELHPTNLGSELLAAKISSGLTSRW